MSGNIAAPPQPPRWTGDADQDFPAMAQYLNDFYKAAVLEGYFTNNNDIGDVIQQTVDPAQATAATAQNTANQALLLAQQVDTRTETFGTVTISAAATTAVVTFTEAQPDTNYQIQVTANAYTGAPPAAAFITTKVTKATNQFTLEIASAPGGGPDSVTFAWSLIR